MPKNSPNPDSIIIGIDPGFYGAIAVIDGTGKKVLRLDDLPITGSGRKREFDAPGLVEIVRNGLIAPATIFIEWPTTRPREAVESAKRFGVGMGLLEGVYAAFGYDLVRVPPATWKKWYGLPGITKDREAKLKAVYEATNRFPSLGGRDLVGPNGGLKDGRAEALLIAEYGRVLTLSTE